MSEMNDELNPDPITGKLNMKTVPMHLTERMEAAAMNAYEYCISNGMPVKVAIAAAARAAIVAAPMVDAEELRIAPTGAIIVSKEWVDSTRKVYDRCKGDPDGSDDARAATRQLRNCVAQIMPAEPPKDWRGATAKGE